MNGIAIKKLLSDPKMEAIFRQVNVFFTYSFPNSFLIDFIFPWGTSISPPSLGWNLSEV